MIWGIDAGVKGAIALLDEAGQFVAVFDMPVRMVAARSARRRRPSSRTKHELDIAMARLILAGTDPGLYPDGLPGDRMRDLVVIELLHAMPHAKPGDANRTAGAKSSTSAASIYRMIGQLEGLAVGLGRTTRMLLPQQWRAAVMPTTPMRRSLARTMGITTKDEALDVARRLYPQAPLHLEGHDGRADGILVGRAGWLLEGGRNRLRA